MKQEEQVELRFDRLDWPNEILREAFHNSMRRETYSSMWFIDREELVEQHFERLNELEKDIREVIHILRLRM